MIVQVWPDSQRLIIEDKDVLKLTFNLAVTDLQLRILNHIDSLNTIELRDDTPVHESFIASDTDFLYWLDSYFDMILDAM